MTVADPGVRRPGRPRSGAVDDAVLAAALEKLVESGISGFSLEAVAAAAGVAKTTIYRRWPSRDALVVDALASLKAPLPDVPADLPVRDALVLLVSRVGAPDRRVASSLLACVMAEADRHPDIAARYEQAVLEPRRERVREVLRGAVARGELRADLDVEVALWVLLSPFIVRGVRARYAESPENLATGVVDCVLAGMMAP